MKKILDFKRKIYLIAIIALFALLSLTVGFTSFNVKAESTDSFEFENGAYIRIDASANGTTGIRFVANFDSALYDSLVTGTDNKSFVAGAEVGMIIVPESYISDYVAAGATDYFTYFNEVKGKEKQAISVTFDVNKIIANGANYKISGAIVKILPQNINVNFKAIAYYTLGGTTYYEVAPFDRTIVGVANSALADTSKNYNAAELGVLSGILQSASSGVTLDMPTKKTAVLSDAFKIEDDSAEYSVSDESICTVNGGIVTAVKAGTTTINVSAYDSRYTKAYSVTVTDSRTKLAAPSDIAINGTIVSWNASSNADGYNVDVNGEVYGVTGTSYDLASLNLNKDAFVKVCAKDSAGTYLVSDYSETIGKKILKANEIATFNSTLYESDFIDNSANGEFMTSGGTVSWTSAPIAEYVENEGNGGAVKVSLAESTKSNVNGAFIKLENALDLDNNAGIKLRFKISDFAAYTNLYLQFADATCLNGASWNLNADAVHVNEGVWQEISISSAKLKSADYGYTQTSKVLSFIIRRESGEGYVGATDILIDSVSYYNGLLAPANVSISGNIVSWDSVENADEYLVNVNGTDYNTSTNSFDFTDKVPSGDIFIKVSASDSTGNYVASEYSAVVGKKVLSGKEIATFNSELYETAFIDNSVNGDFITGGGTAPWTSAPVAEYVESEGNGGAVKVTLGESAKSNVNGLFIKLDNALDLVNNAEIKIRFKFNYAAGYEDLYVQFGDATYLNGGSWNKNADALLVTKGEWQTLTITKEKLLSEDYGYTESSSSTVALVLRRESLLYIGLTEIYIDSLEYL